MNEEEFNLSEKIDDESLPMIEPFIFVEDVKEFIKRINKLGEMRLYRSKSCQLLIRQIDKLVGSKIKLIISQQNKTLGGKHPNNGKDTLATMTAKIVPESDKPADKNCPNKSDMGNMDEGAISQFSPLNKQVQTGSDNIKDKQKEKLK